MDSKFNIVVYHAHKEIAELKKLRAESPTHKSMYDEMIRQWTAVLSGHTGK